MLIALIIFRYLRRCSSCGRWGAMEEISREVIDEVETHTTKILKTKNEHGEVIQTREVVVPATRYTYEVEKQCKFCDYEKTEIQERTIED